MAHAPQGPPREKSGTAPLPAQIDRYDVLGRLGEGGMGEVYLVRDQRLGRQVALKILSHRFAADPVFKDRFLIEARAVSSLEHPHICRLYDVGEWEDRPFFTMERLRGETLRERLRRGPLEAHEVRQIGIEVSDALQAAHNRGVLHCDIKPSNLFLTVDSGAKVMDFGIARRLNSDPLFEPSSDDSTVSGVWRSASGSTGGGAQAGTPNYMSPEQVRGEAALDERSDIFSLGSVLYEMLSGRAPFIAPSTVEVYASILREEPAPLNLADKNLEAAVLRALSKDRANRHASAADLARSLRENTSASSTSGFAAVVEALPARRSGIVWALGGGVLVSALAALFYFGNGGGGPGLPPSQIPLVSMPGDKDSPSLSPSGDRVAFAWSGEGTDNNIDIYVKMVDSGFPLRITRNELTDTNPVWSPDGQTIAFLRVGMAGVTGENGYYIVPALGGAEQRIAPWYRAPILNGGSNIGWSADGKKLVIADRLSESGQPALYTIDIETKAATKLLEEKGYFANPTFSPDGRYLAFLRGPGFISHDLWLRDMTTGDARQMTRDLRSIAGISWTPDSRYIVFSSNRQGLFSMWRVPASSRGDVEPEAMVAAGPDSVSPSIARIGRHAGSRMSYLTRKVNINLWRYPLVGTGQPERVISSTRTSTEADYSPDGTRIAFASDRSGSFEIWTAKADGTEPLQLTNSKGVQAASPRWSPDSKWIIFDSRPEGHADLMMIGGQGEGLRRVTTEKSDEFLPRFSRDGKSIYFFSNRTGSSQLFRMPRDGGEAQQLTRTGAVDSIESLDGKYLFLLRQSRLWRMPIDAVDEQGIEEYLPRVFWRDFALTPQGAIYATNFNKLMQNLERVDFATKQTKPLFQIGPRPNLLGPFVVSPDYKWLLTDRVDQQNIEIMLVENFR